MTSPTISLHQQVLAVIEAERGQTATDRTMMQRGKLRPREATYRQERLQAAMTTLGALNLAQDTVRLAPAQVELVKAWLQRSTEAQASLDLKAKHAALGNDWVLACESISCTEIIAVARVLRDLATLALRADLIA